MADHLISENCYYKLRILDYVLKRVSAQEHNPKTEFYNIQLFTFDFLITQLYNQSQGFPSEEDNNQLTLFIIMGRRA